MSSNPDTNGKTWADVIIMNGRIAILDLTSGEPSERFGDTLTLDVPPDLPRAGVVAVVDGRQGRYLAADGHGVVYGVVLRPLCWRQTVSTSTGIWPSRSCWRPSAFFRFRRPARFTSARRACRSCQRASL